MNKNNSFGNKSLKVKYGTRVVGTLALTTNGKVAFSYDDEWLTAGFSISPFSLPLEKKVFVPDKSYFNGLFGVFSDSLPDAWGQILLNRMLRKNGIREDSITVIDRLALVGNTGLGALEYEPDYDFETIQDSKDLDYLAEQCRLVLEKGDTGDLDLLYKMGGTSGGARPKVMTKINQKDWIIKFPSNVDRKNIGEMEYDYAKCAEKCGIYMTETKLFPSNICSGHFGITRFDRQEQGGAVKKIHMVTAAALLEADYRSPCLDYHTLMKLTKILTQENNHDIENMFRRVCFNVFAHNRDDHAKNFSFLYHDEEDRWRLSPAYDLTYSNTYYGEHTTSVDGNGANPGEKELLQVGLKAGMKKSVCMDIIEQIRDMVQNDLQKYM